MSGIAIAKDVAGPFSAKLRGLGERLPASNSKGLGCTGRRNLDSFVLLVTVGSSSTRNGPQGVERRPERLAACSKQAPPANDMTNTSDVRKGSVMFERQTSAVSLLDTLASHRPSLLLGSQEECAACGCRALLG